MPAVLNITPEEMDSKEKRLKILVCIVGCGQKGIFFAVAFAKAGFKVVCTDADASVVKKLARGKTSFGEQEVEISLKTLIASDQLSVTSDLKKAVAKSDIVVISVPSKVNENKKIDYAEALNACKQVGAALHSGMLVIYVEIVGFGFTEGVAKESLENTSGLKAGVDFGLAYTPIQISDTKLVKPVADLELTTAGYGKLSLEAATNVLKTITARVKQVSDVKTAELAMLFTVAKQDAGTALANAEPQRKRVLDRNGFGRK
jgi:nucleotide sugar dehydrogenase